MKQARRIATPVWSAEQSVTWEERAARPVDDSACDPQGKRSAQLCLESVGCLARVSDSPLRDGFPQPPSALPSGLPHDPTFSRGPFGRLSRLPPPSPPFDLTGPQTDLRRPPFPSRLGHSKASTERLTCPDRPALWSLATFFLSPESMWSYCPRGAGWLCLDGRRSAPPLTDRCVDILPRRALSQHLKPEDSLLPFPAEKTEGLSVNGPSSRVFLPGRDERTNGASTLRHFPGS